MPELTNAQAALQAAATVYSGGRGHSTPASVKLLAESFKGWLDHQDRETPTPPRLIEYDLPKGDSVHPPSRVPSDPPAHGQHFLTENHNADPICHCGWTPVFKPNEVPSREEARYRIREHIALEKAKTAHYLINEGGPRCRCGWSPRGISMTRTGEHNEVLTHILEQTHG